MNFLKYLEYFKAFGKFLLYTLAYLGGRRSATQEIEAEIAKKGLEEATRILNKREGVRAKYEKFKSVVPDSWPSSKRLRKTGSD